MPPAEAHPAIAEAVTLFRSQGRLAAAIGSSQSAVSRMLLREIPISAETAVAIEKATRRQVPRWKLRPDLWKPPARQKNTDGSPL
ncbi:transcriptional regulator [Methylobacterium mesophilicum]|uniref:transcriptional regulator n=1 Tax=Methylobacterium mesophilicum TaxID=39956 RepID=UPI002F308C43